MKTQEPFNLCPKMTEFLQPYAEELKAQDEKVIAGIREQEENAIARMIEQVKTGKLKFHAKQ